MLKQVKKKRNIHVPERILEEIDDEDRNGQESNSNSDHNKTLRELTEFCGETSVKAGPVGPRANLSVSAAC